MSHKLAKYNADVYISHNLCRISGKINGCLIYIMFQTEHACFLLLIETVTATYQNCQQPLLYISPGPDFPSPAFLVHHHSVGGGKKGVEERESSSSFWQTRHTLILRHTNDSGSLFCSQAHNL